MTTLLVFPAALGEPSASPFCVKAICLLRLAGRDFQVKPIMNPSKTPMKKLPVLLEDGKQIADSEAIAAHLGLSLNAYSRQERGIGHAMMRMVEEHTYFALVRERWQNADVWPATRETYFDSIPALMRPVVASLVRRGVIGSLKGQGIGRMTDAFLLKRVEADLDALLPFAEDSFVLGDTPSIVDCSVGTMLAGIDVLSEASELRRILAERPTLEAYVKRVREALYPPG